MGHRNNPSHLSPSRGAGAYPDVRDERDPRPLRDTEDEYRVDPYMVGNNTYRESSYGHEGPGYRGGHGAYEGAGRWDLDEDRARRGEWHSDDYSHPRRGMPPAHGPQGAQGWQGAPGWPPYDPRYEMDQRRDLRRGDRPAGGYGSYGSSDGAYGDLPRSHPHHHDPDYAQWRAEQMSRLDNDYRSWRDERYRKFSDEFNSWRSQRDAAAASASSAEDNEANRETPAKTGTGR